MLKTLVRILCLTLGLLGCASISAQPAWAGGEVVGVVLLHGKLGAPDRHIGNLASALRAAGYLVVTPEMPWSRRRNYDAGFLEGLSEVDRSVRDLRAKGATLVVVAGHSLGGNAALAYAARYPGLGGVICLAAAHRPEFGRQRETATASVAKAKELVDAGKGGSSARFADMNMGKELTMVVTAEEYLSYYDPEGPAVMPRSAAMINPPLPILWVVGGQDPLSKSGPGYVFEQAPAHPLSRYAVVDADHLGTPTAATAVVLEWLKTLPR